MNNNIRKISTIAASFLIMTAVMTSCQKFLDKEPYTITEASFFSTDNDVEAYAIARYSFFNSIVDGGYNIGAKAIADNNTDNQFTQSASSKWINNVRVGSVDNWNFQNLYICNYFFERVLPKHTAGQITGSTTKIEQGIGEMYFFRAWYYFEKLRTIGDFPIIYRNLPDNRDVLVESSTRQPRNKVARMILTDLDSAITFLNETPIGGKNRLSKDAARLFKSRVALYEGTFEKNFAGTAFVPNGNGWPGKTTHPSYVYDATTEVNFFLDQAMSEAKIVADKYALVSNPKDYDYTKNVKIGDNPYYDMFATPDNGLANVSEVLLYKQFLLSQTISHFNASYLINGGATGYTDQFMNTFLMKNGLPIYATGSGYTAANYDSINQIKINRDSRLQLFLKAGGETLNNRGDKETLAPFLLDIGEQRATTGYSVKKGLPAEANQANTGSNTTTGSIIFRSAEAYLNYIEASFERNNSLDGTATAYWQAIRNRAQVNPDFTVTIAATNMAQEAMNDLGAYTAKNLVDATRYNIRRERRCEFIAEGMRWDDLVRWRALDQVTENNKWEPRGFRLWNGHYDVKYYLGDNGVSRLIQPPAAQANVSSKQKGVNLYMLAINVTANNLAKDGIWFNPANYLTPIPQSHFLNSAVVPTDGTSINISTSPIYQNPGWSTEDNSLPVAIPGF